MERCYNLLLEAISRTVYQYGIDKKKKHQQLLAKKYSSQEIPFFSRVISFNNFSLIRRILHLNNNATALERGNLNFDPWHKIRPVLDHLNAKWKKHFQPNQTISIDEAMVGMKNRHLYIQYLPNKRHSRFDIKKFELCDSGNGYCMHTELYSGRDFQIRGDNGQGHAVVFHLLKVCGLLGKGYHLITDNFYTKPKLAAALHKKKTHLTGTVRSNCIFFQQNWPMQNWM